MKLEMGDQIRERPVLESSIKEHQLNIKTEMEKEFNSEAEKTSEGSLPPQQWNIPSGGDEDEDLDRLMSQMNLANEFNDLAGPRVTALCRQVRLVLSRADRAELRELADIAAQKSRQEFVRHLGRLLDKASKAEKGDATKRPAGQRAMTPEVTRPRNERQDKPKRDLLIDELKDENDLCPRSPMRPQHQRPNNFPYQNTSRNHHSGGIMSAVAYSDAIGPTPQYHNHPSFEGLGSLTSRPPLVVDTSEMVAEMTTNDLDSMEKLSEGDLQILMSLAVDLCPIITSDYDTFPESILELNSARFPEWDPPAPDEPCPRSAPWGPQSAPWGPRYEDSGCSSLSPDRLHSLSPAASDRLPPSPDSRRVPDDAPPQMSPPTQFFHDPRRYHAGFHDDRSLGSSGCSSAGIPSPTECEDFDTKVQIASNDYLCSLDGDFGSSDYLLPEFENVFDCGPPETIATDDGPTFAELLNAPVALAPGYVEPRPATQARLVTPAGPNLKRLEPKVEHYLRAETGRERMLKLMDKKKKAAAWVTISLKVNELAKQDKDGDTQLMILVANNDAGVQSFVLEYAYAMVETLRATPQALSTVNHQRQSALQLAALHGGHPHRAIVVRYIAETMVDLGEDIASTSEGGDSLLHELCHNGDHRYDVLVELLSLKNQAGQPYFDVNQYNAKGLTPLHVAVKSHGKNNVTSLMTVQLLVAERADITLPEKSQSSTALHLAIQESCAPRLVEALLRVPNHSGGRACNMLNYRRDSPLHCAASRNDLPVAQQMKVIQLLLEHGAVKSLNANGKFPIALVAEERRQEIRRVYETRKGNLACVGTM